MPVWPPDSREGLKPRADHARRLADHVAGDEAAEWLLDYAALLDEQAASMDGSKTNN